MPGLEQVLQRIVAVCARHGIAARIEGGQVLVSRSDVRARFPGLRERGLADRALEEIRWAMAAGAAGLDLRFVGADAAEYRLAVGRRPEPFDPGV